jgi:hypothetical protein
MTESTLEDLRKQIPTFMWEIYEEVFDKKIMENPEAHSEGDRAPYMAQRVREWIENEASTMALIRTAAAHGFDLEKYGAAVFGYWAPQWDIDPIESEILCTRLIDELQKPTSVRAGGRLPDAFIAATAVSMLQTYSSQEKPPPIYLVELFRRLLNTSAYGAREHRAPYQQDMAAILLAKDGGLKNHDLASAVGVSTSTISGWRNDRAFIKFVVRLQEHPNVLRFMEEQYREDLAVIGKKGFGDHP